MRRFRMAVVQGVFALAVTPSLADSSMSPFLGAWAPSARACRDIEGVERLAIAATRLDWYETHCLIRRAARATGGLRLQLACSGEGRRYRGRPLLSRRDDHLTMSDSPVGPGNRQVYVRCR